MVRPIARVVGIGVETADMLVNEVFSSATAGRSLATPALRVPPVDRRTSPFAPLRGPETGHP
jgi:hypothetical protein